MRLTGALLTSALVVGVAACTPEAPADVVVADGWDVEVVRTDLDRPTQLAVSPFGGAVHVAELAGGEDAGVGRVRVLGEDGDGDAAVALDGLRTPTGLVLSSGRPVLVQEQQDLTRLSPVTDADDVLVDAVRERLHSPPGSNGRSHGTLTQAWELGFVLATATGPGSGPDVPAGTGVLYAVERWFDVDAEVGALPRVVATGFKNAYGHVVGPDGDLWVTEVGDGRYDGEPPVDELNRIPAAVWQAAAAATASPYDGGWPRCTGDADPTEEQGATAVECAALPRPVATFPPRSTPTSVAVTDVGRVLVALWVEGRVVEVDPDTGAVTDVLTGAGNPQHLLAMPDGSVLLTVHDRGELWRLTPR